MENPQIYIPWPIRARAHHRNRGTVVKDRGSSRGAADLAVGTSPPSLMVTERPEGRRSRKEVGPGTPGGELPTYPLVN